MFMEIALSAHEAGSRELLSAICILKSVRIGCLLF